MPALRLATPDDLAALRLLIDRSVRGLSVAYYSDAQIESALRHVFGPDSQLIADRTYYVLTDDAGNLVAAGGWGRRRTLHGGDQMKEASDPLLDPATDPARIRAFYVDPAWARRGLARQLYAQCVRDAFAAGFRGLELAATLPGVPLYRALGFREREHLVQTLPDGQELPIVRMTRSIDRNEPSSTCSSP